MDRQQILKKLHAQININGHIVGAAVGSGMTAKYASMGGADFLLALSAGKYRVMGRSSYASYFCYGNNNDIVMDMGKHELLPIIHDTPILFGIFANDPNINLVDYIRSIKESGFSGVVNFPTLSLIDGNFREALEEEGNNFDREVEAISITNNMGLFTVAFVTNKEEAKKMIKAGADVICVHLGLTIGGFLGAKKHIGIEEAMKLADEIFEVCDIYNRDLIKMIYAGPANTPNDMKYIYNNTSCEGYIGGSTFDRIPTEVAILNSTKKFKNKEIIDEDIISKFLSGDMSGNYAEFIEAYINEYYMEEILIGDLALVLNVSPSYLSNRFRNKFDISFTEYLINFRVDKAKEMLRTTDKSCKDISISVGYKDYAQFSKMFKKLEGINPTGYKRKALNSKNKYKHNKM